MAIKFIVNDKVMFIPGVRKFIPLTKSGKETLLNVPVCRVFLILIENEGDVVSHESLMEQVWGANNQIVTMNTLYQNISLLRRCLKRAGISPKSVRTYSKVGFSFCGKVQVVEDESVSSAQQGFMQETGKPELFQSNEYDNAQFNKLFSKVRSKAKRFWVHFCYVVVFICITAFYAYKETLSMKFTVEQVKVGRFNNCPVYLDKGNQHVDIDDIIKYLKVSAVSCTQDQYVYLTKNFHFDGIIIFICGLSPDGTLICSSEKKLPEHLQI